MLQRRQQPRGMRRISGQQGRTDIVDDHLLDFFQALFLVQQILAQYRGRGFRHVFVLGNGRHFRTAQAAKRNGVFLRSHEIRIGGIRAPSLIRVKSPCGARCFNGKIRESIMNRRPAGIGLFWVALLVCPAIGMPMGARAEPRDSASLSPLDVAEGNRLAHTLCVNCHVVERDGPLARADRVPSFPWIAQQPGLTQDFLRGWLTSSASHERMPDFSLTREEIQQLSAYILSLKKP